MRSVGLTVLAVLALLAIGGMTYVVRTGLSARETPGILEARLARAVRAFAIPRAARRMANPVLLSDDVLAEGMAHFADHCASCHANDGGGDTDMGRGLFPKAPDMRLPSTQRLTDGELFYIIQNGVRFTGMPGWSTGTDAGDTSTWHLVHFIRHLPMLLPEEVARMESMNPRSLEDIRLEIEEERFLQTGAIQ
ncbi:MAG: c-type cytochrome [Vicinamibacterales bacterium]